ncbi:hypothetical protein CGCVW01_v012839 [Colletotrichum viniferum]|nr:hypothetical protein CGCVW01_v012839 [Colletotrichum viniferum]
MEVLGAVSSAVALAEIFAKSVLATKKLWDEAQDVPEDINRLMNDLTHLKPMLEEAEAVFNNQAHNPSTDTALLLMHNYKEVSEKLHLLAADLNQRIVTAKRGKRNLTKLKATLSKILIHRYHKELDSISQTLSFFFNVHNLHSQKESQALHLQSISLHRNMDDKVDQLLSLVQSCLAPQFVQNVQPGRLEEEMNDSDADIVEDVVELPNHIDLVQGERHQKRQKLKPIEWRRPRLLGGYIYQTSEHPQKSGVQEVFQVRLQLPWCLCGRAWDFEAYSSPLGWNLSIRPWMTRPNGDQIFNLVKKGSWPEIEEQLNIGQASISDRNELGHSLLDIALREAHFAVARSLVNLGFEIEGSGLLDSIETTWYLRSLLRYSDDALEWFQFAAELGLLGNLSEKLFGPTPTRGLKFSVVYRYVWTIPQIFSLFLTERTAIYGEFPIFDLFRNIRWYQTNPQSFLELCRNKGVSPQFFRNDIMKVTWMATMVDFVREYFSIAPGRVAPYNHVYSDRRYDETDFKDWKDLAAWVLTDISMDELVWQPSENSEPFASSPFLAGLY